MRVLFLVILFLISGCDEQPKPKETDEDVRLGLGIGGRGVGVVIGSDLCMDAATGQVMVCVEL